MLKLLRNTIKRAPVVGPALHNMYLKARYNEGEVLTIKNGALGGKRWVRFMRTHNDEYVRGDYEQPIQEAVARRLSPGMIFCDVGANAGFFSLLGAAIVGSKGAVISFEPHPETANQLRQQMAVNGCNNVEIIEAAVCDKVGNAEFSDDTVAVMASLTQIGGGRRTITVKTETLDSAFRLRPAPDLIKIDVEGAEIDALRGGEQLIHRKKPVLLVEIHSPELAMEYDAVMKRFNYRTLSLEGNVISAGISGERFVVSEPIT
jgi:FkbM family methyltransferase